MSKIDAYPLAWPAGWKRTAPSQRRKGRFFNTEQRQSSYSPGNYFRATVEISIADGVTRVREALRKMLGNDADVVISSNLKTRLDGLPASGQRQPDDPGVAVYWRDGRVDGWPQRCMAIDFYQRVEHNLAAIAATLEALRAIERHGGAEILDRAFTGFTALPAPMTGHKPWRQVFGFADDEAVDELRLEGAYRTARSDAHPDKGGSHEEFLAVQQAYEAAMRELRA